MPDRPPFGKLRGKLRCVVMAGGRSSRFASVGCHKSMALVRGMPVISHVIDYWKNYTDDFIFVVKNGKEALVEFVSGLPIKAEFVEPTALRGIADGLSHAERMLDEPFIVVLGDCFCQGTFEIPDNLEYGIVVQQNAASDAIRRNYAVAVEAGKVVSVEEKPRVTYNELCGTGFYFFQPDVFDFIRKTAPSARSNEVEITDVLQTIIDHGGNMRALMFDGTYVNVNTPDDLDTVAVALSQDLDQN